MRLAAKFFLAFSLVIGVLAGIAAWSLHEVGKLSIADNPARSSAAQALALAVALREVVLQAKRVDLRSQVFADREYAEASAANAERIRQDFGRLAALLTTSGEKALLGATVADFEAYMVNVVEARELRKRADAKRADRLMQTEAQPLADRVMEQLDRLAQLTGSVLDKEQAEAAATLDRAQADIEELRTRTWTAVITAMGLAVLVALAGTAFIAFGMTRSLSRLSEATRALAEGAFHEPLPVDTRDEIGELARSFNSMAAQLRETDAMKEKFYATVSHELRSPLGAMREAARLIETGRAGPLTAKQERLIGIFRDGTERLLRLVNETLDLSRVSTGTLPIQRDWFGVDAAVRHAIEELRPLAEQRGIALNLDAGSAPQAMLGDEDRIVQVVVNLVGNALRFTPAGGRVEVRLGHSGGEIRIEVEDTGIGIPAALLPVIFDRFRQAHAGKGGTGLGLAIVKSLVEAHDGRVTVESLEGKGSRFTVTLPRGAERRVAALEHEPERRTAVRNVEQQA